MFLAFFPATSDTGRASRRAHPRSTATPPSIRIASTTQGGSLRTAARPATGRAGRAGSSSASARVVSSETTAGTGTARAVSRPSFDAAAAGRVAPVVADRDDDDAVAAVARPTRPTTTDAPPTVDVGRVVLGDAALPIGFEGPITDSDASGVEVMGVRVRHSCNPADQSTPLASCSGDTAPVGDDVGDFAVASFGDASWNENYQIPGFGERLVEYVPDPSAVVDLTGSLKHTISKMTAGKLADDAHTIEPQHFVTENPSAHFLEGGATDGGDFNVFEPRENVAGGRLVRADCDAASQAIHQGACDQPVGVSGSYYYSINGIIIYPSTLPGFLQVTFDDIRGDGGVHVGQFCVFIGHWIENTNTISVVDDKRTETSTGIFFARELDACDALPPTPWEGIYEGPLTYVELGIEHPQYASRDKDTWGTMWIMGSPVKIHPDFEFDGPTVADTGAPITGMNMQDLQPDLTPVAEANARVASGRQLGMYTATAKGVAAVELVDGKEQREMRECVLELAENVVIHPDVLCTGAVDGFDEGCADIDGDTIRLFPNEVDASFQMVAMPSTDPVFPGGWVDVGGEPLTIPFQEAIAESGDGGVGLGGYFRVHPTTPDDGTAGTFFIVSGETAYQPPGTVSVARYNVRYDPNDEIRVELRGSYRLPVEFTEFPNNRNPFVKFVFKHKKPNRAAYKRRPDLRLVHDDRTLGTRNAVDTENTAWVSPSDFCNGGTCRSACEIRVPEDPNNPGNEGEFCDFRIQVRQTAPVIPGLADVQANAPSLALQYLSNVLKIRVFITNRELKAASEQEVTPTRLRLE